MNGSRAPAQALALLTLAAAACVAWLRVEQAQMKTPLEGVVGTTLPGWRIDLDRADPQELALLPGVGPSLAAAIVADREARGPFRSPENLGRVRGVGPAILEQIRPFVLQPAP